MKRRDAIRLITISGIATVAGRQQGGNIAHPTSKSVQAKAIIEDKRSGHAAHAGYKPRYFSEREFAVVTRLADLIIPRDSTPGALDALAHKYVDLQVAEMPEAQVRLSGGIQWLDRYCAEQFGRPFLQCPKDQQRAVLDRLAFGQKVLPELHRGRLFFVELRDLVSDGFYSSEIGFAEVGYQGNTFVEKFVGCTHVEHLS